MPQIPSLPPTGIFADMLTGFRRICETINLLIQQIGAVILGYNPTFATGYVAYGGPTGLTGDINFEFGKNLPNPSGINGNCLLLGSGFGPGGSPNPSQFWIITDQAYDDFTPGNTLGITSGETQGAGSANGGPLLLYGGASFGGIGGPLNLQGGTSANGAGGPTTVTGGNATGSTAAAIPGDLFLIGGQVGKQGAAVHLIATVLNGIPKEIRHRFNSTITIDELVDGSWFFYAVGGGTYGTAGAPLISRGVGQPMGPAIPGTDVVSFHVMPTAKLTTGGANGSLTITNGLITTVVDPT